LSTQLGGVRPACQPANHTSTDLVLGTPPVVPAFAPPIGGSCTQPAAISVKAIAAITASDFMIFPDGKTYQGISGRLVNRKQN